MELIMSMVIIGVLALVISDFYSQRLVDYARNFTLAILQSNTKQAIDSVSRDIRSARMIENTNSIPDTTGATWTSSSGSGATLVLAEPAQDSSGNLIYVDPTVHNTPYINDVVYYLSSSSKTLLRRVIANTNAPGNAAVSTGCNGCPADGKVIEDVADMSLTYYDGSGAVTTTKSASYLIDLTLKQSRAKFGRTYTNTLTSRVMLRNKP